MFFTSKDPNGTAKNISGVSVASASLNTKPAEPFPELGFTMLCPGAKCGALEEEDTKLFVTATMMTPWNPFERK